MGLDFIFKTFKWQSRVSSGRSAGSETEPTAQTKYFRLCKASDDWGSPLSLPPITGASPRVSPPLHASVEAEWTVSSTKQLFKSFLLLLLLLLLFSFYLYDVFNKNNYCYYSDDCYQLFL